jgi:putative flippase GtrA
MTKAFLLLRFLMVGGSTAAMTLGLTYALVEGLSVHVTVASSIACITAICYNYFLHYHWTFASDAPHGRVLARYLLMAIGAVLLNGLVMHFGLMIISAHYMLLQIVSGAVMLCWSLCISAIWVYR